MLHHHHLPLVRHNRKKEKVGIQKMLKMIQRATLSYVENFCDQQSKNVHFMNMTWFLIHLIPD